MREGTVRPRPCHVYRMPAMRVLVLDRDVRTGTFFVRSRFEHERQDSSRGSPLHRLPKI